MNLLTTNRRLHIWSHPRSLSTAVLRSFQQRSRTKCFNEPFLLIFNKNQSSVPDVSARQAELIAVKNILELPLQHLITSKEHCWIYKDIANRGDLQDFLMTNSFHLLLIRHPAASLQSYLDVETVQKEGARENEIELEGMIKIFDFLRNHQKPVLVVNSDALLLNPQKELVKICNFLNIDFTDAMLSWPDVSEKKCSLTEKSVKPWFETVAKSTGFQSSNVTYQKKHIKWTVPPKFQKLYTENLKIYRLFFPSNDI